MTTSLLSSSFEGMEGFEDEEDEEDVGMFRLVDVEEGSEVVLVLQHMYISVLLRTSASRATQAAPL